RPTITRTLMTKKTRRIRKGDEEKGKRGNRKFYGLLFFIFPVFVLTGCAANEKILRSGSETPSPTVAKSNTATPEKVPFARDLEEMRTAGFAFIYALRRKDGGKIDVD